MAAWATTVSVAGGALHRDDLIASGRRAIYATFAMTLTAAIGLWTALLSRDFSLEYVAGHISANMPNVYVFTAFWSGQAGSMLFWALILSLYSAIAVYTNRERNHVLLPYAAGTLGAILLFFLATTCFKANPFTRLDWTPLDGRGMNPQLQNPGMAIHPPNLYLGYVATAIPFAFAIAALITRRLDAEWLAVVRRWSLLSWFFLTIGIVLGMWWAYVELGWGGYWAWDPVENASFLPWLTGTAFLHSIMIQEKRGMLRNWNVVLVVVTFLLSIFGTFITRSGVIESVHSFAQSPVGSWFAAFFFAATGATIYLVATRLKNLESKAELESMVSREAAFLYNNLVVLGALLLALGMRSGYALVTYTLAGFVAGTILQEFYKGVSARRTIHGESIPLGFVRLVARNRRRYGGYIVHAGIVMLFAAFAGLAFRSEHDITLRTGQSFETDDPYGHHWRFVSQGASTDKRFNRVVTSVALETFRDGRPIGFITSEKRQYFDSAERPTFEPSTEVGIRTTAKLDTYVVLAGVRGDVAELRVTFNPLVVWVWIGGALMAIGGLVVMWPQAERRRASQAGYVSVLAPAHACATVAS